MINNKDVKIIDDHLYNSDTNDDTNEIDESLIHDVSKRSKVKIIGQKRVKQNEQLKYVDSCKEEYNKYNNFVLKFYFGEDPNEKLG